MKKLFVFLAFCAWSLAAFALPTPHQIEDALAARDYVSARGMVQSVLQEHPESARAHLMNAYLLEHVDHNLGAARAELQTASGLDKRGDVKGSALFGRVVAEMDVQGASPRAGAVPTKAVPVVSTPAPVVAPPRPESHAAAIVLFVLLILVLVGLWILISRSLRPQKVEVHHHHRGGDFGSTRAAARAPISPDSGSGAFAFPTPVYEPAPTLVHTTAAPARAGMTAGENFMSTAGGVVAGNVISDALLHHPRDRDVYRYADDEPRRRRRDDDYLTANTYVPVVDPAPAAPAVDYASERASFSSSSSGSDSWGSSSSDTSSSSSGSDSWGSSSDSSSSSDSGSSWD